MKSIIDIKIHCFHILKKLFIVLEDLVQEVFLRLHKQDFEKIKNHISAWLFTVCRNLSFKKLKKENRYVDLSDQKLDQILSEDMNPHEELDLQEQKKALKKCIKNLTPMQKEIIKLRYLKDYSIAQIAKKMKVKTNSVSFHICKGSQSLRKMLQKEMSK
jgi:RNA polymerase sigma-70 factor (ECF subfamily)